MSILTFINRTAQVIRGGIGLAMLVFLPIVFLLELLSIPDPFKKGERPVYQRAWDRMWRIWGQLFWQRDM